MVQCMHLLWDVLLQKSTTFGIILFPSACAVPFGHSSALDDQYVCVSHSPVS